MMHKILIFCLWGSLFLLSSCRHDPILETVDMGKEVAEDVSFLFLSHCRMETNSEYNSDFYNVDFLKYDILLLGGDLAEDTSEDTLVMSMLDTFFDFKNENTLWALGNHDYADLELVSEYTGRPAFYSYHFGGITFLVLDTQDDFSNFSGEQLALIEEVTDTIENSGALILLQHKLTWVYNNPVMTSEVAFNGQFGNCFYCVNPNNFYEAIYPRLVEVEARGVEVYCLAGDLGFYDKTYHYLDPGGIDFLACGMNLDAPDNVALVLNFDGGEQLLSWEEVLVSDL